MLMVDDNETCRLLVADLASHWGMTVREAASGAEALELLAADGGCDVGMIDLHMPEMDGEQLAQRIHKLPGGGNIPLVLLTSMGRRVRSSEFAQILAKPIKAEALRAVIQASLRRQCSTGKSRAPFPSPTHDSALGQRCPLRLLIAEDNAVNQRVASLLLQRLGYRATTVANGTEAFAALQIAEYDAILMDIEMPELDGCEATRQIRAMGASPKRPWIIALTAGALDTDRERAIRAGMNDFLIKPVRTEALSAALERAHLGVNADDPVVG
jgi:CheY-like chemotaxis protein